MADVSAADILALATAAGVHIPPELVTEVGYSLNGLLEVLARVDAPDLESVEALPILLPPSDGRTAV